MLLESPWYLDLRCAAQVCSATGIDIYAFNLHKAQLTLHLGPGRQLAAQQRGLQQARVPALRMLMHYVWRDGVCCPDHLVAALLYNLRMCRTALLLFWLDMMMTRPLGAYSSSPFLCPKKSAHSRDGAGDSFPCPHHSSLVWLEMVIYLYFLAPVRVLRSPDYQLTANLVDW